MATQQSFLIADMSTYANYFGWGSAVSAFIASVGWLQGTDTGQIMWTGLSITAVSMSGSNMTCTYSGLTGLALAVGRTLTITGWTGGNTGNNGTFRITGLGAGTFTCVNASGVNVASGGTGIVTQSSTVPTAGNYVYEIWHPGDGLQDFVLKLEYGNSNVPTSGANWPTLRLSLAQKSDGAGNLLGFATADKFLSANASTTFWTPSPVAAYECNFSGDSGRLSICLFRNNFYQCQWFGVQRSLSASGSPTSTYVSMWGIGNGNSFFSAAQRMSSSSWQVSLHFQYGVVGYFPGAIQTSNANYLGIPYFQSNTGVIGSLAVGGSIPLWNPSPVVGMWDYPCTVIGIANYVDFIEGVPFTVTNQYGQTKTYIPTKTSAAQTAITQALTNTSAATFAVTMCMEYD